jgi:hypothetical protein
MINKIETTTFSLLKYCKENDWAGYDPYDALNSRVFARTPFINSKICRIAITQIMKRLPINLRSLLLVQREQNPKAIALFLMSLLKLERLGLLDQKDLIGMMVERLIVLRSPNTPYWCWGYSFPWQTRTILVPRGAPNLVCTVFAANALLDAYENNREPRCLEMAISAAEYILNELFRSEDASIAGFSYPLPSSPAWVHNANFLGAALLCRVYKHSGKTQFLDPALKVTRYSIAKQHNDGGWDYGESLKQRWIDNFHTGYNLCALQSIEQYTGISEFDPNIRNGFKFYSKHFFREDGAPKYFHERTYPIDIHCVAQSIITLVKLRELAEGSDDRAHATYQWAMHHMWDEHGYFYYQVLPYFRNKISYVRWSQAWMLLALSTLLEEADQRAKGRAEVGYNQRTMTVI